MKFFCSILRLCDSLLSVIVCPLSLHSGTLALVVAILQNVIAPLQKHTVVYILFIFYYYFVSRFEHLLYQRKGIYTNINLIVFVKLNI